jgi:multicomponent Na+:H+ antiporter subunit F
MIDAGSGFSIALTLFAIAFVLAFVRLLRGPSLPDRVVALDLMVVIGIGFISACAIEAEKSVFVDVATVVALIGFLATVAFAYHVRRGSG